MVFNIATTILDSKIASLLFVPFGVGAIAETSREISAPASGNRLADDQSPA